MEKLEKSLERFLQQAGYKKNIKNQEYISIWPQIVGSKVEQYSEPYSLKNKKLYVKVADSVWLYHLTLFKEKLIADFNRESYSQVIDDIIFVNAELSRPEEKKVKENLKYNENISSPGAQEIVEYPKITSQEEQQIEDIVKYTPSAYRDKLKNLMQSWNLKQKKREEEGGKQCLLCSFPFFMHELKQGLCFFCWNQLDQWEKVIKRQLFQTPWINVEEIKKYYPSLQDEIFFYCKRILLEKYRDIITKIMQKKGLREKRWNNILKRLAQRYIMLIKEKKPFEVEEKDITSALKDFAGLHYIFLKDE